MMRKKIVSIVICTAVFMAIPSVSAFALDGWQQDEAQEWIYKENDKKLVNQWITWIDGTLRYVGGDGKIVKDNWVNFGDKRYRVKEDGARYEDQWFNIMSSPALPSAKPVTNWYYAGADGSILKDGWHEVEGRYYYFYPGGNSPRKSFFNLDDKRYYVDENGARMAPGWFSIDNVNSKGEPYTNWYYVNEDGSLLRMGGMNWKA